MIPKKPKANLWRKIASEEYPALEEGTDMAYNWAEDPQAYGEVGALTDSDVAKVMPQNSPYSADSFEPLPGEVRVAPANIWEALKQGSPEPTIFNGVRNTIRRKMWTK